MKAVDFPGSNAVYAKDQQQYLPLPAHIDVTTPEGVVTFCWQLTLRERLQLLFTGRLWHQVMAFHKPLQPQRPSVERPYMLDTPRVPL